MVSANLSKDFEDLNRELSGWGDNESTETIVLSPLGTVELLEDRD